MSDKASHHSSLLKRWVDSWRLAGRALDNERRSKLQHPDYGFPTALRSAMLAWAVENSADKTNSGLIEQQRFFKKLHNK